MAAPVKPLQHFGSFLVSSQVFYRSASSFALVNLKPLLPGHVLVCPQRVVARLKDLTAEEVTDLFLAVQHVGRHIERIYAASALNIAIQDGAAAGQSVPHVHAHVIPRAPHDLPEDEIYRLLEGEAGDVGAAHAARARATGALGNDVVVDGVGEEKQEEGRRKGARPRFPAVKTAERSAPRSEEEMAVEAGWLEERMKELD